MSQGARTKRLLRDCAAPPEPRRYLGAAGSDELQMRALALWPDVATAEKWLAAIEYLRRHSKIGWRLDDAKGKP